MNSPTPTTVEDQRLRFIRNLTGMSEAGRAHLLRIETDDELGELYNLAMSKGLTGVAESIAAISSL